MLIGFIIILMIVLTVGIISVVYENKIRGAIKKINKWGDNHKVLLCLAPFAVAVIGLIIILIFC